MRFFRRRLRLALLDSLAVGAKLACVFAVVLGGGLTRLLPRLPLVSLHALDAERVNRVVDGVDGTREIVSSDEATRVADTAVNWAIDCRLGTVSARERDGLKL